MAYQFSNQILAKVKVTDEIGNDITLNGINGQETDANVIMGGISIMFNLAGWTVSGDTKDIIRIVEQKVEET